MSRHYIKYILFLFTTFCASAVSGQQLIRTIAGDGTLNYNGDGGSAIAAAMGNLNGVAIDDSGNVYASDNYFNVIRKITKKGIISSYCGNGSPSFSGDGGPASAARISAPFAIVFDTMGNMLIADAANHRVRKIDTGGIISTIAGIAAFGYYNGDGIPAVTAKVIPNGLATDTRGNIFIADANTRVRKIVPSGIINAVAGAGCVGNSGNGGAATAACMDGPIGVCADSSGNVYIADRTNNCIRKVSAATGIISVVAGSSSGSSGFSGDGGQATSARLSGPNSVRIDPKGNLVIVDQSNNRIRRVNSSGIIRTIAGSTSTGGFSGDGGPATSANMGYPSDVAWDSIGNMYIADKGYLTNFGHRIRVVFDIDTMHITASPGDTVCGYSDVTYTTHEYTGHFGAVYQWRVNGTPVGFNQPTYFTDSVHNGDRISCTMKDTAAGGFIIAVSDTLQMVVRPVVVPRVDITTTGDTVCAGQVVTLTANPVNGGLSPIFMWYVFGTFRSSGPTFSYIPNVGDIVTAVMVSNAVCAFPDTVRRSRTMIVNVSYPPLITLDASPNDTVAHYGDIITLFSEVTYGGAHPTFQWYRAGVPIPGATNSSYFQEVYWDDSLYCVMHSDAPCVVPEYDTSEVMFLSIGRLAVDEVNAMHASVHLSPNPNSGSFYVRGTISGSNATKAEITVTDLLGRQIFAQQVTTTANKLDTQINLDPSLATGVYLLTVKYSGGVHVLRFHVNK